MSIKTEIIDDWSHRKFIFKIQGLDEKCGDSDEIFKSSEFLGGFLNKARPGRWSIGFIPRCGSSMKVVLQSLDNFDTAESQIHFKYAIINECGEHVLQKEVVVNMETLTSLSYFPSFIERKEFFNNQSTLMKDNTLQIYFDIKFVHESAFFVSQNEMIAMKTLKSILSENFSDVTVSISGTEFKAHKLILAESSEVLFDKLKNSADISKLEINDVDPSIAKQMFNFIYENKIENYNAENVQNLLIAANQYKMERLKKTCEKILFQKTCSADILQNLKFADANNFIELKSETIKTLVKGAKFFDIITTDFILENSKLFNEIFKQYVNEDSGLPSNSNHGTDCKNKVYIKDSGTEIAAIYEKMFEEMRFPDIVFNFNGNEVKAHKSVLASRSEVFNAMFSHDMLESNQNKIDIVDCDHKSFIEFLRYLYCEKINCLSDHAINLLPMSEKYDVKKLKNICNEYLKDNIKIDSALDIWNVAFLHNPELEKEALDYIIHNLKEVVNSAVWDNFVERDPRYLKHIFEQLATTKKSLVPTSKLDTLPISDEEFAIMLQIQMYEDDCRN